MKTNLHLKPWLVVLVALVALLVPAACSSSPATTTTITSTTTATPSSTMTASPSPTATATPTPTATGTATPTASGQAITIDLVAQNIAFDKSTISVPAGANVSVNFNNKDTGIPHNFAVYQTLAGGQTKPIFIGNTIVGPSTATYHFTAPSAAGTYFFECDVHPTAMNGTFVVISK